MQKLNKRGQITIPEDIRSSLSAFPGMKFEAELREGKIVLIPYHYKCADCGSEIPEGTKIRFCEKCTKKRITQVY